MKNSMEEIREVLFNLTHPRNDRRHYNLEEFPKLLDEYVAQLQALFQKTVKEAMPKKVEIKNCEHNTFEIGDSLLHAFDVGYNKYADDFEANLKRKINEK